MAAKDWSDVYNAPDSNSKTNQYQAEVMAALERCFPLITVRRKASDPPWFNERIRKKIRQRRGIYKREGRSNKWKKIKKHTENLIRKRRDRYALSQKDALLANDGDIIFFKNVKNYRAKDRPKVFDVKSLFPGLTPRQVAEELASHFNKISSEFEPLQTHEIPVTHPRALPVLLPHEVAGRIRAFRKPKSMVRGDIFPALMSTYGDLLALPLCNIYNCITLTKVWPSIWKEESVTVIPKKTIPESMDDLRNISCTALPSKIYESYVLNWTQEEVATKTNQYGGVKNCSTAHFLCLLYTSPSPRD